ncbi:MAG: putative N-acetyl-gamma-glutamyl-phosphate reductase, chloroplastic [Rickettsiaceae bacterium]|nr:putative N-acetyl-gamma-glutamyl-phosphate reductase, chloroplastic [Rickettsiaceae bacterium]
MKKIKATIIGASGYTGVELIRLLLNHPNVEITQLIADSSAGQPMSDIYQHLRPFNLPALIKIDAAKWDGIDVAFCCLPHATTQEIVKKLPEHLKIIDLSADFRLYDVEEYKKWYGHEHLAPELQKEAVYGLVEVYREYVKNARIIACPGCYPTSATLPLYPLLKDELIEIDDIIIDSKSGVTGAGRSAKQANLYTEVNEGIKPYGVCNHRHIPEIEQTLSCAAGESVKVNFTPQLTPMNRGILSTIYVKLKQGVNVDDLRKSLQRAYDKENFVHVLKDGQLPSTHDVYSTNNCIISVSAGRTDNRAVISSVIDNLTKGASGQAVQNMNIIFGFDEKAGLEYTPVFP